MLTEILTMTRQLVCCDLAIHHCWSFSTLPQSACCIYPQLFAFYFEVAEIEMSKFQYTKACIDSYSTLALSINAESRLITLHKGSKLQTNPHLISPQNPLFL